MFDLANLCANFGRVNQKTTMTTQVQNSVPFFTMDNGEKVMAFEDGSPIFFDSAASAELSLKWNKSRISGRATVRDFSGFSHHVALIEKFL